jgi:DNA-binding CsgD family transcriptional regulator
VKTQIHPAGMTTELLTLLIRDENERARPIATDILANPDGDDALAAAVAGFGVIAWSEGRLADALGLLQAALRRMDGMGRDAHRIPITLALARTYLSIGAFDEASACVVGAQRDLVGYPECPWQPAPAIIEARIHLASGCLDAAAGSARRGLALADRHRTRVMTPVAWATLALVELQRGDVNGAAQAVAGLRAEPLTSVGDGASVYDWVESRVREAREGPERALALIDRLYADSRSATRLFIEEPSAAPWLARIALRAARHSDAAAVMHMAARLASDNPWFGVFATAAEHVRGLVDGDADALGRAAEGYAPRWDRGSALEDAASALLLRGDHEAAQSVLSDAIAEYRRIDARRDVARAQRRARSPQPRRPVSGCDSFTTAEWRVVEHVASGLTNREVAERLFLSRHTVDFHLRQAFRKTGVRSRVQLARLVLQQHVAPGR